MTTRTRSCTFVFTALSAVAALLVGCAQPQRPGSVPPGPASESPTSGGGTLIQARTPSPAPVAAPAPVAPEAPRRRTSPVGSSGTRLAFPTGDERTSAVLVAVNMPREVRAGQEFTYDIQVTNLTNNELQNVILNSESITNLTPIRSEPAFTRAPDGDTVWLLGNLPARSTRDIRVTSRAESVGDSSICLAVAYNNVLCANVLVVQPALALTKTAQAQLLLCDVLTLEYVVTNTGSGVAEGVRLRDTFPQGLVTTDDQQSIDVDVGDLAAGQSRTVRVTAKAARTGTFSSPAQASSAGGLTASAPATTTVVRQPVLAITAQCTENLFAGRTGTYAFTVRNTGDAPSENTVVEVSLPANMTVQGAVEGGTVAGSTIRYNVGTLTAGQERVVSASVKPGAIGSYRVEATAGGECANPVNTSCQTVVSGIPAILLEVIDTEDPIEVGAETTYVIEVTNQGSAPGTGIRILADLPGQQQFVSASGVTAGSASGARVTFAPLASLAPGAKAAWRITVKAANPGDVRFKIIMTSDQFTTPVEETEATNLYR
ncbi:MAG: hypothetical protein C0468_02875 [Planctomyces sp.]|nr:hypothetical protein [Planctomyces sp.]